MLHRSISKLTNLCVNQDARIATIRAVLVALLLGGMLLFLMHYQSTEKAPDFTAFEAGEARKQAFFDFFLPLVEERNQELRGIRDELQHLVTERDSLSLFERMKVNELAEQYEVEDFDLQDKQDWDVLIRRVDVVPPSLALAQAANESAWGTSRFARQGNNYYGQWCFVSGCGIVPSERADDANHEVAHFTSPEQSVERYIHNLNQHPAYRDLRLKRASLRDQDSAITGLALVSELDRYSERGTEYVAELTDMIRYNNLEELDLSTAAGD